MLFRSWLTFNIPGDGEYSIAGSQLFEFKKKAKGFPTTAKFRFTPESYGKINFKAQEKEFKNILDAKDKTPEYLKPSDMPRVYDELNIIASTKYKWAVSHDEGFSIAQFRQNFTDWLLNSGVSKEVKDFIRESEIPRMEAKEKQAKPTPAEPSKAEQKAEPVKEKTEKPVDYAKLKGIEITAKGIREKTGETFNYKEDAATALKDIDDQISAYEKILNCVAG